MLPQTFWREIEGAELDGIVRVGQLLRAEREGLFVAEPLDETLFDGCRNLAVRFIRSTSEPVVERYLEAGYVSHPNLLRCFAAGSFEFAGTEFVYAVLERAETTLADVAFERPLTPAEAKDLGLQLIPALACLHQRDLVYCNLDPATVARTGNAWKLSEYSQLRLAGNGYDGETRRMLALSAGTPPEAWDGVVSPAWDAWSLAWLLAGAVSERKVGARETAAARPPSRRQLPEPFSRLVSECLNPNAAERCSLQRIEEMLRGVPAREPAEAPRPVPMMSDTSQEAQPARGLRALNQKQAMLAAAGFFLVFVILATLAYHPNRSSTAARIAAPAPLPAVPVSDPARHTNGEADRVTTDTNTPTGLLDRWADAIRTRNLDKQLACYAPTVYAFYGNPNVTLADIRDRRARAMKRSSDVRRLDISNVDVHMKSPTAAVATFDERWDFAGSSPSSGKVQERLGLRRIGGQWRITSESNTRTYYKSGANPQS